MILTVRTISKFYRPWFYLGLLFLLCCRSPVHAADNLAEPQPAAVAGIEKSAFPAAEDERDHTEPTERTTKAQGANLEQPKIDLSTINTKQSGSIYELEQKLKGLYLEVDRKILINTKDIDSQKFLVENYAAGGFETLLKMADLTEKVDKLILGENGGTGQKPDERQAVSKNLNHMWMLIAILLVSLAPLAFSTTHGQQPAETQEQQQMVLFISLSAFMSYFLLGFGLMFGASAAGWIGLSSPVFAQQPGTAIFAVQEFMLYQLSFPILTALIIHKAIGQELSSAKSILLALCIGAFVVPVFGHWAAAGRYIADNSGWLETEGFLDNAGTTTIHAIAAWFILVWARKLGAQNILRTETGPIEKGTAYSVGGVIFLWLSTLGLATGTLSISGSQIATTMLNVGLAAAGGALGAILHVGLDSTKAPLSRGLGGVVAALAAIGAAAPLVTNFEAILIGFCAGIIYNLTYNVLRKRLLPQLSQDQAASLVAMHGVGGVWGSLCVALFGSVGLLSQPKISLLFAQLEGMLSALIYSVVLANLLFLLFNRQRKDSPR
jgi:Amt family ammonium transporter